MFATKEVQKSLLNAVETGQKMLETFVNRVLDKEGEQSIYSPISRSGVVTFADMAAKTKLLRKGITVNVTVSPETVFRRSLALLDCREDVTAETILSHPIGPVPTSMFHDDRTMQKTVKADLGHKLEAMAARHTDLPQFDKSESVYIRDSMATIQSMVNKELHIFDEMAAEFVRSTMYSFHYADTVTEVFDRYEDVSAKAGERERRSLLSGYGMREYSVIRGRAIPPLKKFLNLTSNKRSLIKFLGSYIQNVAPGKISDNQKLYIAGAS